MRGLHMKVGTPLTMRTAKKQASGSPASRWIRACSFLAAWPLAGGHGLRMLLLLLLLPLLPMGRRYGRGFGAVCAIAASFAAQERHVQAAQQAQRDVVPSDRGQGQQTFPVRVCEGGWDMSDVMPVVAFFQTFQRTIPPPPAAGKKDAGPRAVAKHPGTQPTPAGTRGCTIGSAP